VNVSVYICAVTITT